MSVPRPSLTAQQAVQGRPDDGVEFGGRPDESCPLGMAGGERRETPAKGRQGLDRHGAPAGITQDRTGQAGRVKSPSDLLRVRRISIACRHT